MIADTLVEINPLVITWEPDPTFRAWLDGMALYDDGEPLMACTDDHQHRGWLAAERAEAQALAATTPMYERRDWQELSNDILDERGIPGDADGRIIGSAN